MYRAELWCSFVSLFSCAFAWVPIVRWRIDYASDMALVGGLPAVVAVWHNAVDTTRALFCDAVQRCLPPRRLLCRKWITWTLSG